MTEQPAITGLGLVTVLGRSVESTWHAMTVGDRCVTDHTRIDVSPLAGLSRTGTLAVDVAHQAIAEAGWSADHLADPRTALVVGTSKGPIEDWIVNPRPYPSDNEPPAGRSNWGLGQVATEVAATLGLGDGPRLTLSAACATGLHAVVRGCMMLRAGEVDRVLVVGVEASVHPLFIHSFQRLGVLAPPGLGCRPFDASRAGFVMTEAAAAVCLERVPAAGRTIVHVERFAIAGDAAHLTANEPTGRTLRHVLSQVVDGRPVDLVHAHGTGTVVNDPIELAAIDGSLPRTGDRVPVFSHKAHLGHTLGAAGLVATVLSSVAHQQSLVPPNSRTTNAIGSERAMVSNSAVHRPIRRSLALAAGFGGAIGAMSLVTPV